MLKSSSSSSTASYYIWWVPNSVAFMPSIKQPQVNLPAASHPLQSSQRVFFQFLKGAQVPALSFSFLCSFTSFSQEWPLALDHFSKNSLRDPFSSVKPAKMNLFFSSSLTSLHASISAYPSLPLFPVKCACVFFFPWIVH